MKVRATRRGYYGKIRVREGDEFFLEDKKDFSKQWMVEAGKAPTKKRTEKKEEVFASKEKTNVI